MSSRYFLSGQRFRCLPALAALVFFTGFTMQAAAQIDHLPYQLRYNSGQTIQPIFQGWSRNDDGSFDMHFGYLNRNYIEQPNVPIGPDNFIDMAGLDQIQRQPTYFYPRTHRDIFTVTVPADFGDREIVWNLTTQGQTLQAIGWLQAEWEIDEFGGRDPEEEELANQPPELSVATATSVTLPASLSLTATVSDDGLPVPEPESVAEERRARAAAVSGPTWNTTPLLTPEVEVELPVNVPALSLTARGDPIVARAPADKLTVSYIVWRGPGDITAEPEFAEVENGSATTTVTFTEPGEYELKVRAFDGGKSSYEFIEVNVLE